MCIGVTVEFYGEEMSWRLHALLITAAVEEAEAETETRWMRRDTSKIHPCTAFSLHCNSPRFFFPSVDNTKLLVKARRASGTTYFRCTNSLQFQLRLLRESSTHLCCHVLFSLLHTAPPPRSFPFEVRLIVVVDDREDLQEANKWCNITSTTSYLSVTMHSQTIKWLSH